MDMLQRAALVVDWGCTAFAVIVAILIGAVFMFGRAGPETGIMVAVLFGPPAILVFIVGKAVRFIVLGPKPTRDEITRQIAMDKAQTGFYERHPNYGRR